MTRRKSKVKQQTEENKKESRNFHIHFHFQSNHDVFSRGEKNNESKGENKKKTKLTESVLLLSRSLLPVVSSRDDLKTQSKGGMNVRDERKQVCSKLLNVTWSQKQSLRLSSFLMAKTSLLYLFFLEFGFVDNKEVVRTLCHTQIRLIVTDQTKTKQ